jgi:hypothetical protein
MSSTSYKIMNKLVGLTMYLSNVNKSVIGEYTDSMITARMCASHVPSTASASVLRLFEWTKEWTVERTYAGSVTGRIKSNQNGLYVGYEGSPGQGVKAIVGADH